jgi:hypothetical protein
MYSKEKLSMKYDDLEKDKPIKLFNRKNFSNTQIKSQIKNKFVNNNPSHSFEIK